MNRKLPTKINQKEVIEVQCQDCDCMISKQRGSLKRWSGRCGSCAVKFAHTYKKSTTNKTNNGEWTHRDAFIEKPCLVCAQIFKPCSGIHKFCSEKCKGEWQYINGRLSTKSQYQYISGNWKRYFTRLCCRSHKRETLTVEELLELLAKQEYRCALSGVELTCKLERGKRCLTNASLDRIDAGGAYTIDNIQLVCTVLNSIRRDTSMQEFIEWCKKVSKYHG